jgi:uncharacterized membrane protein YkoI
MTGRKKSLIAIIAAFVVIGTAAGIAIGGGGADSEAPITGNALEKASAAALDHTGGGEVTDTEKGDEEGYYEVEVTRDDGSQVDVHLDEDFNVLGTEDDGAGEDDEGADQDD